MLSSFAVYCYHNIINYRNIYHNSFSILSLISKYILLISSFVSVLSMDLKMILIVSDLFVFPNFSSFSKISMIFTSSIRSFQTSLIIHVIAK